MSSAKGSSHELRFNGVYQSGLETFWFYLRFYEDGTFVQVGPTSGRPNEIAGWFHRDSDKSAVATGAYTLSDGLIRFWWPLGRVEYEGTVSDQALTLKSHNHANNHRGTDNYRFIED
jgi:hypothetical protein